MYREDGRGLVVKGTHWLLLGAVETASHAHRSLAFELFHQPILSFARIGTIESYDENFSTSVKIVYFFLKKRSKSLAFAPFCRLAAAHQFAYVEAIERQLAAVAPRAFLSNRRGLRFFSSCDCRFGGE